MSGGIERPVIVPVCNAADESVLKFIYIYQTVVGYESAFESNPHALLEVGAPPIPDDEVTVAVQTEEGFCFEPETEDSGRADQSGVYERFRLDCVRSSNTDSTVRFFLKKVRCVNASTQT